MAYKKECWTRFSDDHGDTHCWKITQKVLIIRIIASIGLNARDEYGKTGLVFACKKGQNDIDCQILQHHVYFTALI